MPFVRPTTRGLGILLYLCAIFFFALNDALGKWLVVDYGVGQLLALRAIGAGLVLAPMIWRRRGRLFDLDDLGLQSRGCSAWRWTRSASITPPGRCRSPT
jgi:hypothetical protein